MQTAQPGDGNNGHETFQTLSFEGCLLHYKFLEDIITESNGETTIEQRRQFAARAFEVCAYYDIAISNYFNAANPIDLVQHGTSTPLRYGENPHQKAAFHGDLSKIFTQLHGKEISYNNLVDIDALSVLQRKFH